MSTGRSLRSRAPVALAVAAAIVTPAASAMGQDLRDGGDDWATDFSRHTVPLEEIVSGGPPKDGIPAIDEPRFETVDDADDWIAEREPVIVVSHGGDAHAYPYQVLLWHEIVNDEVGGRPLAVTYCPLCNTALVFDRGHGGRVLDFGTTGRLRFSDLVMYDRQTESWWQQATGEAIVGELAGERLQPFPAQTTSWAEFKDAQPGGKVLSKDTGYDRPYGQNPYRGYDRRDGPIASFFRRALDDRLAAMERVVSVTRNDVSVAFPFERLREERVVNDEIAGEPVVVFWSPGTASALDDATVRDGRDVGTTGVFFRSVAGRTLTFRAEGDGRYRDQETGTTWSVLGRGIDGPLGDVSLEPIPHGDYLWFAWAAFRPDTEIR